MSKLKFAFDTLGKFRKSQAPFGYPNNFQHLFAPIDDVHGALVSLCESAEISVAAAMYGYDDDEINSLFLKKLEAQHIPVILALDYVQSKSVHEKKILETWKPDQIGNSLVVGKSIHGAISHDKMIVLDGVLMIAGSTNLSHSGESLQNNECIIMYDAVVAAEARARIDMIHNEMHEQMLKRGELTS